MTSCWSKVQFIIEIRINPYKSKMCQGHPFLVQMFDQGFFLFQDTGFALRPWVRMLSWSISYCKKSSKTKIVQPVSSFRELFGRSIRALWKGVCSDRSFGWSVYSSYSFATHWVIRVKRPVKRRKENCIYLVLFFTTSLLLKRWKWVLHIKKWFIHVLWGGPC